jgi:hypothetical protein
MEKGRRKVQVLTAEQLEVFCTCLAQKETEPPPQPETFKIGEIVRAVYPELKKLRENGYSLRVLVRVFEENGVVITTNALSTTPLPIDSTTGVISMVL